MAPATLFFARLLPLSLTALTGCSAIWDVVQPPVLKASRVIRPLPQSLKSRFCGTHLLNQTLWGCLLQGNLVSVFLLSAPAMSVHIQVLIYSYLYHLFQEVCSDSSPEKPSDSQSVPFRCLWFSISRPKSPWVPLGLLSPCRLGDSQGQMPGPLFPLVTLVSS